MGVEQQYTFEFWKYRGVTVTIDGSIAALIGRPTHDVESI